MKPKMRAQILKRHNKLVDSGRTAWTTEERDRCRLLDYVAQLEEVPCTHCLNKIAALTKRLWDHEHQASDERIRDEK